MKTILTELLPVFVYIEGLRYVLVWWACVVCARGECVRVWCRCVAYVCDVHVWCACVCAVYVCDVCVWCVYVVRVCVPERVSE